MLARSLANLCGECHQANNGQEAVQLVRDSMSAADNDIEAPCIQQYDVILMDYYMPVMNGPEAVRKIRELGYKNVILAVTGSTSLEEQTDLESCGVNRILTKPFSLEAFKAIIAEFREKGQLIKEA
eukprot:gene46170-57569_t